MLFFLWPKNFFYGGDRILYMCNLHNIFLAGKIKEYKRGEERRKKATKKCRMESEIRQEKGLHEAKMAEMCYGNDTGHSIYFCQAKM